MSIRGVVTYAQAQGSRDVQEDFLVNVSHGPYRLIGILDGHGGDGVAQYCARTIPQIFDFTATDIKHELQRVITILNESTRRRESGSTLSLAHIDEARGIATIAVLGDSPIIVIDEQNAIHRSAEHNVRNNETERTRAIGRGAFYSDGYIQRDEHDTKVLQLSRALGDRVFDELLDRMPDIHTYRLGAHSVVIVGSDGMFDPAHGDDADVAAQIIAMARKRKSAAAILRWRKKQTLKDNASLIIWHPRRWREWLP